MTAAIRQEALRLGFSACGIAKAVDFPSLRPFYTNFIARGAHQSFSYLERYTEQRLNISLLMPEVSSVIAVLMNYYPPELIPEEGNYIISKYAYGSDYPPLIKPRLAALQSFLEQNFGASHTKIFVDSGPVLEKAWAMRCGVGWQGKNTLIINKNLGSYFFIGLILTSLELEANPPETDRCGSCERCVRACPTGALNTPYQLEIGKCISFHTIENKGAVPEEIKKNLNDRIYGCDICQDECPYNQFAIPSTEPAFSPSEELKSMRKKDWESLTQEQFDRLFRNAAVKRTGYQKLMRNISAIAPSGNCQF